jgi:hypothetical protein
LQVSHHAAHRQAIRQKDACEPRCRICGMNKYTPRPG